MRYAMNHATPTRRLAIGYARKDGPSEQANPERHGNRPVHPTHPDAARGAMVHPGPAAPRGISAWRQANSQKPDTLLPGHGGAFSNGDRRRSAARNLERHAH